MINFSLENFKIKWTAALSSKNADELEFERSFFKVINKHAPHKSKTFHGNHKPKANKTLYPKDLLFMGYTKTSDQPHSSPLTPTHT